MPNDPIVLSFDEITDLTLQDNYHEESSGDLRPYVRFHELITNRQ